MFELREVDWRRSSKKPLLQVALAERIGKSSAARFLRQRAMHRSPLRATESCLKLLRPRFLTCVACCIAGGRLRDAATAQKLSRHAVIRNKAGAAGTHSFPQINYQPLPSLWPGPSTIAMLRSFFLDPG